MLARALPALEGCNDEVLVRLHGDSVLVRDEDDEGGRDAWGAERGYLSAKDALRAAKALVTGLREVAKGARETGVPVCFDGP